MVPVSSLGTIPVGVICMKTPSNTMEPITNPADSHRFWMKNSTCFLYLPKIPLYESLKECLNLLVVMPANASTLMIIIKLHRMGCSLKLNRPKIMPRIATVTKSNVIPGRINRPREST